MMMPKKIAFTLCLLLITGSLFSQSNFEVAETRTISSDKQYLIAPKWSPNGEYIAAAGENYGSIWLYTMNTEKWKKLVEENGTGWDFDWSPDSRKIAFRANIFKNRRKQTTIKYVDISTGTIQKLVEYNRNFSTPKWLTDDVIAFLHNDKYKTISVNRKAMTKLDSNVPQKNVCLFSSDGIYAKTTDQAVHILEPLTGQTLHSTYSPDGTTIVFQKPGSKIFSYHEASETVKFITEGEMPGWSPDGKFIVYAKPKDDGYKFISSDIFICDANGKINQQLTQTDDELEMRPYWSPDGKKIACDSNGNVILISLSNEVK
jgi:Tol biopolymer transport system component